MNKTSLANGITAADLRTFLEYWSHFSALVNEATGGHGLHYYRPSALY